MTNIKELAERFSITDAMNKLHTDLLSLDGVVDVQYDLDGYLDDIFQVIIIAKYDIPVNHSYYEKYSSVKKSILSAIKKNGLKRTPDTLEDYGEHFYIVTEPAKGSENKWLPTQAAKKEKK
jgi:hypothetical protein